MKKSLTVLQGHVPLRKAVLSGQEQTPPQPHCPDEKTLHAAQSVTELRHRVEHCNPLMVRCLKVGMGWVPNVQAAHL